ncbi:TPA: hypothetical protein ACGBFI_005812 [Escherichia coli]
MLSGSVVSYSALKYKVIFDQVMIHEYSGNKSTRSCFLY